MGEKIKKDAVKRSEYNVRCFYGRLDIHYNMHSNYFSHLRLTRENTEKYQFGRFKPSCFPCGQRHYLFGFCVKYSFRV